VTREEFNQVEKLSNEDLAKLGFVESDALKNHVLRANDADARVEALGKAHEAAIAAAKTEHATSLEESKQRHDDEMERLKTQCQAVVAKQEEAFAAVNEENQFLKHQLKEAAATIETLGGTELGRKMAREKRRAELNEQHMRLQQEMAALGDEENNPCQPSPHG
jgi:hypothetical protein